jgi:hypothetical protein
MRPFGAGVIQGGRSALSPRAVDAIAAEAHRQGESRVCRGVGLPRRRATPPDRRKVLALDRFEGRPALVLEGFPGPTLDRLLGAPMPPGRFLTLALSAAEALAEVHRRGVIHKDIKPHSLIVDERDRVTITDFGIATPLPREQPLPRGPELMEGSPAYMSPEQTGRMHRSLDQRTDARRAAPFRAAGPVESVHCHIARVPPSPVAVVPGSARPRPDGGGRAPPRRPRGESPGPAHPRQDGRQPVLRPGSSSSGCAPMVCSASMSTRRPGAGTSARSPPGASPATW